VSRIDDPRTTAFMFASGNDWARAIPELRRALTDDPEDASTHALLALALSNEKDRDGAIAAGRRAVALDPEMDFAHYALGMALYEADDMRGAETAAREALRLEQDAANYALLGQVLAHRRRWKEALAAAEDGLRLEPSDAGCANVRTLALSNLGRADEAEQVARESLERDPEDPYSLTEYGWVLLRQSRYDEALATFRAALRLSPSYERARLGIVEALKARSGVYRLVLRYVFWLGSFEGRTQYFILFGLWFASRIVSSTLKTNPAWWPVLGPLMGLYFVFAISTWLAAPLSNLMLRLNPFGKLVLSEGEITASNLVGGCLVTSLVSGIVFVVTGATPAIAIAIVCALLMMPIAAAFAGEGTRAWKPLISVLALLTVFGAAAIMLSFFSTSAATAAGGVLLLGVFLNQWLANYLLAKYS
jgi:tetratricopeptide (TPR) repeat protein